MNSNKRVLLAVRLTSLLERNSRRVCEIGVGIFGEGKYLDHMYEVDPYVYLPTIVNKLLSLEIRVVVVAMAVMLVSDIFSFRFSVKQLLQLIQMQVMLAMQVFESNATYATFLA